MPIPKIMSAAVVEKFRAPLVMRELPVALESINDVSPRLKTGKVNGRVVLTIGAQASQEAFRKSALA